MVNLLPYNIWLDIYRDDIEDNEVVDTQAAYQLYRDSFFEDAIDAEEYNQH